MPPGVLLATFSGFSRMIWPRNFGHVCGRFFHASGSLLDSFGHRFRDLSVVLGSGRNSTPVCTGATFSVFQAIRNTVFSGIAFEGHWGTIFSTFWRTLGSAGAPIGATLGTNGRLCREGFFDGFGCQNDGFLGSAPTQGNRPSSNSWPRARKEIDFVP